MDDAGAVDAVGWVHEPALVELLTNVTAAISSRIRLSSGWNGRAYLKPDLRSYGITLPDRTVLIRTDAWNHPILRWRVLIHEALHCFSNSDRNSYPEYKGWEEGVVEGLQRLMRQFVIQSLGFSVNEAQFRDIERDHPFNPYIESLQALTAPLGLSEEAFYIWLLPIPLRLRPMRTWTRLRQTTGLDADQVTDLIQEANAVLRLKLGYDS